MYKLYTDKAETFECSISLQGASLNKSQARLIVESDDLTLLFTGKIDKNGKCSVPIKKLKGLLEESSKGTVKLEVIAEDIGDNTGAVTRFICAQKPGWVPEATGNDRTSIAVFIDIDHAGALLEILQVFAKNSVNLTFIQSRPTGRELGHYHFIIDVEGHINDLAVGASMTELKEICDDIRFLGSYPREAQ